MKFFGIIVLFTGMLGVNHKMHSLDVQGHRGARGLFPENTLPAFMAAIEAGVSTLELDLHITLDDEIVIHHDFFIFRKTCSCMSANSSRAAISSLRLLELKRLDYGSKTDPNFPRQQAIPGTQIPTLDELFTSINQSSHPNAREVRLNLEIKRDPRHPELTLSAEELAKKIIAKVREKGFSQRVYYSSFDAEVLLKIYELDPQAELGFIFSSESLKEAHKIHPEDPLEFLLKLARSFKAKILSPEQDLLNEATTITFLKESGFQVVPWTVNSAEQWTKFIELGVDGLITDYPQDLISFLEEKGIPVESGM